METINPVVWGRSFWHTMETVAAAYPAADVPEPVRDAARHFYRALATLLPCAQCRMHYAPSLDTLDEALSTRDALSKWVAKVKTATDASTRSASNTTRGHLTQQPITPRHPTQQPITPRHPTTVHRPTAAQRHVRATRTRVPRSIALQRAALRSRLARGSCNCGHK